MMEELRHSSVELPNMNNLLRNIPPIILASSSPRRKQLLELIDLPFTLKTSAVIEDFNLKLKPINFAKHYAQLKARTVAQQHPNSLIIGADTIVVLDNEIIGKPKNLDQARSTLNRLAGRTHEVITAITLIFAYKSLEVSFFEKTKVTLQNLTDNQIEYYIKNYNPLDKAGSYGIQDWFAVCIKKIDGCYYNVMGFPLSNFYQHLIKLSEEITQ